MNKTFQLYGIIFIILMLVLALLELNKTEVTDWRKNFEVNQKSPFGLFVFNKEANHLLNNELNRSDRSPYEHYKTQKENLHNILIIQSEIDFESWKKILEHVKSGSDALIIAEDFHPMIADSLHFKTSNVSLRIDNILTLTDDKFSNDSIKIDKLPAGQGFSAIDKDQEILGKAVLDGGKVNFIKINVGKGHFYLHTEPLILTNYYLLKPENQKYVQDVFSYLPKRKTIWFTQSNKANTESQSPLRFILSKPPLRFAWWLFLAGLLLFVIFNAKRKQRIVPVIEPLKNKSVEFLKSIGNLYLQEGDFHEMMAKKAQYFLNRVRHELMIDTQHLDEKFVQSLHLKTGKSLEKINKAIDFIKRGQDPSASVMKEDLVQMNRLLDEILK